MKKLSTLMLIGAISLSCTTGCVTLLAGGAAAVGTTMVATDSRTTGTMIDDESIEMKSSKIISNNREIYEASKIDAASVNGKVLLSGQCQDPEYVAYIVDRVSKVPQVREVINRIENIPPVSMGQRSTDSWITTKVKTQLLFGEKINSNRFKVITENNTVFLLGLVTQSEANRAVNVARTTDGVKKVVKVFDYISENSKVAKIFNNDTSNDVPGSGSSQVNNAAVEESVGNSANEAPIYYEEVQMQEQPIVAPSIIQEPATVVAPSTTTVTPVVVSDTVTSTDPRVKPYIPDVSDTVAPVSTTTSDDDSFIIE